MENECASVTLVVTVRERFSLSERSLSAIYEAATIPFKLVYVVGGAPRRLSAWLQRESEKRRFTLIQKPHYLTPNQSRNIGFAQVDTKYVLFIENDVVPSKGWLEALLTCARQTGAEAASPVICESFPLHGVIHQAGGSFVPDPDAFFAKPAGARIVQEEDLLRGKPIEAVGREMRQVQMGEFHCILVKTDFLRSLGGFDEQMMSTREHVDFAISIYQAGGKIILAPNAIVTFLAPWNGEALRLSDMPYHLVRWSPEWAEVTTARFRSKWGLNPTQRHDGFVKLRYADDIVRPLVARIPIFGRSWRFQTLAALLLAPLTRLACLASARANNRRSHRCRSLQSASAGPI